MPKLPGDGPQTIEAVDGSGQTVRYIIAAPVPVEVRVEEGKPWSDWANPQIVNLDLRELNTYFREGVPGDPTRTDTGKVEPGLILRRGEHDLGLLNLDGLGVLGKNVGFPADFVNKVSPELGVAIVNERIQTAEGKRFTIIQDHGEITNMAPDWRELIPYPQTAQFCWDTLRDVYGDNMEVTDASANGKMRMRIKLPVEETITPKRGDILKAGIEVNQHYSDTTLINLYAERLICTNGAVSRGSQYKWEARSGGTREHQFAWLRQGLAGVLTTWDNMVNKSRQMADTHFSGDPGDVLREHASAMRLPKRYHDALLHAFDEEPGNTEWDIFNAFTRLATHGDMDERTRYGVQRAAGDWAQSFEMVHARLPRPMAMKIGAEIIEEPALVGAA